MQSSGKVSIQHARAGIFDRLGFDYKSNEGIMYPNMQRIDDEMGLFQDVLKRYIS